MKYSIITINFNNKEGLRKTIESVIHQTFDDFEYIIIDGGSTDGSMEVIEEYAKCITYWVSEKDRGIYHAMNKGVSQAHGDYCIFMNSGDFFHDNRVLEIIEALNIQEDILVGKVYIDGNNTIISPPPPNGELTFYHLFSGAIPHQGSFIRTELLHKYPYDETLRISSDWKFFVQTLILDNVSYRYLDVDVACYNLYGISTIHSEKMKDEKEKVLKELFPQRVLADYYRMKASECQTQLLTPKLRVSYRIDRVLYAIGKLLLKIRLK